MTNITAVFTHQEQNRGEKQNKKTGKKTDAECQDWSNSVKYQTQTSYN
jgi:hypothetical protein